MVVRGPVQAGDPIVLLGRPEHDVTVGLMFRALTTEQELLPQLLVAGDDLLDETRQRALRRRLRAD